MPSQNSHGCAGPIGGTEGIVPDSDEEAMWPDCQDQRTHAENENVPLAFEQQLLSPQGAPMLTSSSVETDPATSMPSSLPEALRSISSELDLPCPSKAVQMASEQQQPLGLREGPVPNTSSAEANVDDTVTAAPPSLPDTTEHSNTSASDPPATDYALQTAGTLDWLEFPDWGATPERDTESPRIPCEGHAACVRSGRRHAAQHAMPPSCTGPTAASANAVCAMSDAEEACLISPAKEGMQRSPGVEAAVAAAAEPVQCQYAVIAQCPDKAASVPPSRTTNGPASAFPDLYQTTHQAQLAEQSEPIIEAEDTAGAGLGQTLKAAGMLSRCSLPGEAAEQATKQSVALPCQQRLDDAVPADVVGAALAAHTLLLPGQLATVPPGKESLGMHMHLSQDQDAVHLVTKLPF